MALIRVPKHRPEDLAAWARWEREDAAWARTEAFRARCREALDEIAVFAARGPCYAAVSWGKDSTVIAHLVWSLREERGVEVPLIWIRWDASPNPHCPAVRDAFLSRWPMPYREQPAVWDGIGDPEVVWREALARAGRRYRGRWIGGMRADESCGRARRMKRGLSLGKSCQPLGHWTASDVFAYLFAHDLPVHPAYAMTFGGSLDRGRIRVAALLRSETRRDPASWRVELEERGTGLGRAEWEAAYYGSSCGIAENRMVGP